MAKPTQIEVGHILAKVILEWTPNGDQVPNAIMEALEACSITLEAGNEARLRGWLFDLTRTIEARIRSI